MKQNEVKYCRQCVMQDGYSTLLFDEGGLCSDCQGASSDRLASNISRLSYRFDEMVNRPQNKGNSNEQDCLVMLSGGKDSIYMLYLLTNVYKRNPLAYTINLTYESGIALRNVEHVIQKLKVPHFFYTPNPDNHKEIMKNIFNKETEETAAIANNHSPEKSPCLVCTYYMMLLTILFANKMRIPYIVYCADPGQCLNLFDTVEEIIDIFTRFCGEELVRKIFANQLDELMNNRDKLPQIVYPYASVSYNEQRIITELNQLGLYDSHPTETHCTLFGLLNYFSVKKFNRYFYAVEVSMEVRKGTFSREDVIRYIDQFKKNMLKFEKEGKISEETKEEFKRLLRMSGASELGVEHLCNSIIDLPERAKELGVELETPSSPLPVDASTPIFKDEAGDFGF
jgi:hypothetical protein